MDFLLTPEALIALAALTGIEIVLGIDNVVFIAVVIAGLDAKQQRTARAIGLLTALALRVLMLSALISLLALTQPALVLFGHAYSWRDVILLAGGGFLIIKATHELYTELEGGSHLEDRPVATTGLFSAVVQIAVLNLVFSIDSTITAIGMARNFTLMVLAIVIAMIVMYVAAGAVSSFIRRHPATKILALAFLLIVGIALVAEGMGRPFERSVLYAAMGLSTIVAVLAMGGARRRRLRQAQAERVAARTDRSANASS